jgi:hypothetical protein
VVLAAAVILFVYGALLVVEGCGWGGCAALASSPPRPPDADDPMRLVRILLIVFFASDAVAGGAMLVAGVGLLYLNRPARTVALIAGVVQPLKWIAFLVWFTGALLFPAAEQGNQMALVFIGPTGIAVGIGSLITLAACVPVVVLLSLRSARDAFVDKDPFANDQ